jgi:hypothetical protein
MYSLIRKSAVLLSLLTLLPLSSASAGRKNVPFRLMDGGLFKFPSPSSLSATLEGSDLSTHMGKIVSGGDFANVGPPIQAAQMASKVRSMEPLLLLMETSSGTPFRRTSALIPMLRVSSTA